MFQQITNLIKINSFYKQKMFKAKLNKNDLNLLKIFIKINIVKFVKKQKNSNIYIIYLNYFNENIIFKNIINMYKPSQLKYASLKNLKETVKKKN
jgi:hypothetical protein